MMKTYLKKAFQLSDSGAKGLVKSIWSFFLYYVSFVPPMICGFSVCRQAAAWKHRETGGISPVYAGSDPGDVLSY